MQPTSAAHLNVGRLSRRLKRGSNLSAWLSLKNEIITTEEKVVVDNQAADLGLPQANAISRSAR